MSCDFFRIDFAVRIREIGAFKDKSHSPEGRGFKLKLHELNPDAPLSPFYLDFRLLQSDHRAKHMARDLFDAMISIQSPPDLLAAIPEAIVPVVSSLSDTTGIPMITPRLPKSHGSGAKIDGIFTPGQTAILFDDVVTGADSKLQAAATCRAAGLVVKNVFVLVDRQQGGAEELIKHGLELFSALKLDELLEIYQKENMIHPDIYTEIQQYRGVAVK